MTYSNWKGSSGWGSVNDPTGVLGKICLKASSGKGQLCEDYLTQEIGTSNAFNKVHYKAQCDFATIATDLFNGSITICARASNYSTLTTSPIVPQQSYCGVIDFFNDLVIITRKVENKESVLISARLGRSVNSNLKYSISLECYGNTSVGGTTLKLKLNNEIVAECIDGSGLQLLSGSPGIQVQNGTVYINNFAILEIDSYGNAV